MSVSNNMICSYADGTTIYASDYKNNEIIRKLENDTVMLSKWFQNNSMSFNLMFVAMQRALTLQ